MKFLSLSLLFVFAASACADNVVVFYKGKAHLVDLNDSNVVPTATVGKAPTNPTDPKPDPDPDQSSLSKEVKKLSDPIQDETTLKLVSLVYGASSQAVASGKLAPKDASAAVDKLVSAVLVKRNQVRQFKDWRNGVSTLLNAEHAAGRFTKAEDVAKALAGVSAGIELSLEGRGLLDKIDLKKIIAIVIEILSSEDGKIDWLKLILKLLV